MTKTYTVAEAAQKTGLGLSTVRKWALALDCKMVGRSCYVLTMTDIRAIKKAVGKPKKRRVKA
jgi:hypothetical protein